jgi:hypothetical protein
VAVRLRSAALGIPENRHKARKSSLPQRNAKIARKSPAKPNLCALGVLLWQFGCVGRSGHSVVQVLSFRLINGAPAVLPFEPAVGLEAAEIDLVEATAADSGQGQALLGSQSKLIVGAFHHARRDSATVRIFDGVLSGTLRLCASEAWDTPKQPGFRTLSRTRRALRRNGQIPTKCGDEVADGVPGIGKSSAPISCGSI